MKKCPNCSAQIADDSRFCTECGKEIAQGTVCPHCGANISEGDSFCQNCGKKLTDTPNEANEIVYEEEVEEKSGIKKYLPYIIGAVVVLAIIGYFSSNDSKGGSDTQTVVVDSLAERNNEIEDSKPSTNPFVGKTYKGGGNGGGLGINMRITFVDDKECLCVSDWYQAYSTEKQIRCAYDVKDNHVIIHVNDDGNKYDLDFDVKEDGRVLSFDKSDPSAGGSMGNDYMSFEIVDGNATDGTEAYIQSNSQSNTEGNKSDNSYSKYVGRWILRKTTDEGNRMRIEVTLKDNKSGENVVFAEHGNRAEVLVYEEYQQCILNDGVIYLTKDGDINGKGVPKLRVGSDGLYSFSGEKYTRKLE